MNKKHKILFVAGGSLFCLLLSYVWSFVEALNYPLAYSFLEGKNIYESLNQPTSLFTLLLGKLLISIGKSENFLAIFPWSRLFVFASLPVFVAIYCYLLRCERVFWLVCLLGGILFLSLTMVRDLSYQASPHIWSLGVGLWGVNYFFSQGHKDSWKKSLLASLLLFLPFALSGELVYLSFALLPLSYGASEHRKLLAFSIVFLLLHVLFFVKPASLSSSWSLESLLWNMFPLLANWSLWAFVCLLLPMIPLRKINPRHPSILLFWTSLFLNLLSTGLSMNLQNNWLVTLFAGCWILTLLLDHFLQGHSLNNYLISFLLCVMASAFVLPGKAFLVKNNKKLLHDTSAWLEEGNQQKRYTFSQDLSFNLLFASELEQSSDDITAIEKQKFDQIVLTSHPCSVWPAKIVEAIERNYFVSGELLIFGEKGVLMQPRRVSQQLKSKHSSMKVTFTES